MFGGWWSNNYVGGKLNVVRHDELQVGVVECSNRDIEDVKSVLFYVVLKIYEYILASYT